MKKYFVFVMAALCMGFAACSDEDEKEKGNIGGNDDGKEEVVPSVTIDGLTENNSVIQFDTLYLKATIKDFSKVVNYKWIVNGEEVAAVNSYKFTKRKTGDYKISLAVSGEDGKTYQVEKSVAVVGKFGKGSFILNEGNMGNETGSLTFVDEKGVALDSAYYRVNGTLLGNVCQDMFISSGKMYIISQNGAKNGGEGMLSIAKADNLEKIEVYSNSTLSWPSHIAVVGDDIYIRDGNGICLLKATTKVLTRIKDAKAAKNRMVVIGDKVFAMNGKDILVLQNGTVVKTITMPGTLSGIAKSYDGQLWASCTTNPAQFLKINSSDYSIMDSHELGSTKIAAGGASPAFSAVKDTLYFRNTGFELYRHIYKENKTEFVANIKELVPNAGMYYNSLGVNPVNGEVYFATLKGYGMDYKINDIAIFNFSKNPFLQHDFKSMNSFPAGVYFTYNFE